MPFAPSAHQPPAAEPHPAWRARPVMAAFLATRPPFLTITLVAVLLGFALAWWSAGNHAPAHLPAATHSPATLALAGLATLLVALLAHAAANVINDVCDTDTDMLNHTRLFPFTGGSRFLQNGVFSRRELGQLAAGLVAAAMLIGTMLLLWLARTAPALQMPLGTIGLAGCLLAWSYSAAPLRLAGRGLGEVAIALAWSLVVAGSAIVMAALLHPPPSADNPLSSAPLSLATAWLLSLPFGLLVANILYINQFPDAPADALAGKRTWPVRLGRRAIWGYPLIALLAALSHIALIAGRLLPPVALAALLPLVASVSATRHLFAFAHPVPPDGSWSAVTDFRPLLPAIAATLVAAHGYALLLALLLVWAA